MTVSYRHVLANPVPTSLYHRYFRTVLSPVPSPLQNLVVGENLAFPNQLYEELDGEKKQPLPADEISVEVPKTDVVA